MITLKNVNKYFFRHKKNEIHVIDNTSLEFDNTGLVALLGPSGCGKTTLLNAIGGLDKINSGTIYINGIKMPRIGTHKKDKIRVMNVGYIFQNYNLLDNLSVFENVAISLKMIGIKNRLEIKKRVDYVLESVGMYRFRNKPAGMLSGGQRQRVGIARALVKNPAIIIADEPTGNLDSKNTIEIMNIIKSISQDRLVILVTHEKDLAYFYSSRIVEIMDGKVISDIENNHSNELDYRIDNKIYLKDFKNKDEINVSNHNINIYSDKKEKLKLDIVIKNGNIYINNTSANKIEIVDENSGIEFLDEHYKKITKEDFEKNNFDLSFLDNSKYRLRYSSIYDTFSMIKTGFNKVRNYSMMKKLLLLGFGLSSMFIVYAVSNIFGVTNINDKDFINVNKNYVIIENNINNIEDYYKLESLDFVDYIMPGTSIVSLSLTNKTLLQLSSNYTTINGSLASSETIIDDDIILGQNVSNNNEIVIDKLIIDRQKDNYDLKMLGFKEYENFLGHSIKAGNLEFIIVGISDTNNPCFYTNKSNFIDIISNVNTGNDTVVRTSEYNNSSSIKKYSSFKNDIVIKNGKEPINDYEVVVNINNKYNMPLNKTIDSKVNGQKLKVVGYYESKTNIQEMLVNDKTYNIEIITKNSNMTLYVSDKIESIENLQTQGFNAKNVFEFDKNTYINNIKDNIKESLIIAGILLVISFIEIFLMIRASFLSRVKEVGIYRAIGVKKNDIYKMFLGEILVITSTAGLLGAIFMIEIIKEITKISYLGNLFVMDLKVILISLFIIYTLNIIMGLLPIRQTIKKTPAEILARNDID